METRWKLEVARPSCSPVQAGEYRPGSRYSRAAGWRLGGVWRGAGGADGDVGSVGGSVGGLSFWLAAERSPSHRDRRGNGIRRSGLGARRSWLGARRSALVARGSALVVRRSWFGARRSALGARRGSEVSPMCPVCAPGGRVASCFNVRCIRSCRPFCSGCPGSIRSGSIPIRIHHADKAVRP